MNSIFASAGANSSNLSFSTPPMQKSSSNLHGRKRFVDGGSADDGASNGAGGPYRSVAYRTEGARLACLVNASVTVCGDDEAIYAFGGFDQYTDEVYNHVLKLDLHTYTWTLVDNYGDIPSVRMGHTTTYWRDNKLVIFGGENEHRMFLSDVYIFDISTATWSQPVVEGHPPSGRSRHAVVLHEDKLFILGGIHNNPNAIEDDTEYNPQEVLDDICYLDLKSMTWSRSWKWIARFDHQAWVRDNKLWVFGGMGKEMDRTGELISLDLNHPAFARTDTKQMGYVTRQAGASNEPTVGQSRVLRSHRPYGPNSPRPINLSQRSSPPPRKQFVPAATSSVRFLWGRDIPSEAHGTHFHHICGNTLLDFVTSANTIDPSETGLCALDLNEMTWRKMADGPDIFGGGEWRWHYLAISPNSTMAYLLGCPTHEEDFGLGEGEEYLSDVLPIDLSRIGIDIGQRQGENPHNGTLGWDLASVFDNHEMDTGADFVIRAMKDEAAEGDEWDMSGIWGSSVNNSPMPPSDDPDMPPEQVLGPPIKVHKLILLARWPHFATLYNARMREFHRGSLYLPEAYSVVRAFMYYLYSDSIATSPYCANLSVVAGLLVMANIYNMKRLRTLALGRLFNELDIESAAVVWERAGTAGEEALRKKAARFALTFWGRIVRTMGFRKLSRRSVMELCEETDVEGRVMGGEELGSVGAVDGSDVSGRGFGGIGFGGVARRKEEDGGEIEVDEDDEML
ncbi:uncharacterized protein LAJ45_05022 [Morchella importuna]|uniref:uncharacterized protein n=1 Tax=Morchella importuna TaxID=1174673 RepID=UPI001E8EDF9B|nr:uncharacterized protein LAJ45_05022 [Morchella importuna]KAH8150841.1 hypothetical protein LAJ45_05022 [Morchella importuna]